jgi:hypothetical protein
MNGDGYLTWADGREYKGQFKDDKRHGQGTFKWKDGRVYQGEWRKGKQHGVGYYQAVGSNSPRLGEWENGKRIRWANE